ncbi:hypothetical protein FRC04_000395 [Tulasnella sp. 424]|nr:hypothetical protein FRC04_000395 [Tulasnella sp. 424]KAG8973351.1 hypothetical protein FRC05_008896 [Tulasnella sp. 425]
MPATPEEKPTASTPKLPPGTVLGPDGKPCKICNVSSFKAAARAQAKKDPSSSKASASVLPAPSTGSSYSSTAAASVAGVAATLAGTTPATRPTDCPPDVEDLGRATWTFLHTTAAYYPEKPTPTQRSDMLNLLKALPNLYPCGWCASHLKENMAIHPPDKVVDNRLSLSRWLCARHNDVNERLGKPIFDCSKTDERWKDGPKDGSCD